MAKQSFFRTQTTFAVMLILISVPVFKTETVFSAVSGSGNRYALLIGVNEYDNAGNEKRAKESQRPYFELQKLNYCCVDMTDLGNALVTSKFAARENITVLTSNSGNNDTKATLTNINRELKYLLSKLQPNDTVFIAFAGHGLSLPDYKGDEKSELYLCPMDAEIICNPKTGKFDHRQLLSRKQLEIQLENSRANIKILVMDACRNNGLRTRSLQSPLMTKPILNEIDKIKDFVSPDIVRIAGLFQLFSCGTGETAAESPELKHGIYSYFMIEGLKGFADSNGNNVITLAELQKYVKDKTFAYAKGVLHHHQAPKITTNGDCTAEEILFAECTSQSPAREIQPNPATTAQPNSPTPAQNPSNSNYNNYTANNYTNNYNSPTYNAPQNSPNTNYNNYANNYNQPTYNAPQSSPNTNYNNYANNYNSPTYNSPQSSPNLNYNNYGNNFGGSNYGGGGGSYGGSSGGGNSGHRNTR
ncbi:MAG: caspase family protein [Planctomycetaceae bacterium]|nr:caspase family protein [Planctomycetaceae bacterium]